MGVKRKDPWHNDPTHKVHSVAIAGYFVAIVVVAVMTVAVAVTGPAGPATEIFLAAGVVLAPIVIALFCYLGAMVLGDLTTKR